MSESLNAAKRTRFLLVNLFLIFLCIVGLVFLIAAYRFWARSRPTDTPMPIVTLRPTSTATQTSLPSFTPTRTRTPLSTLTPTVTPTPTRTLAPSNTPTTTGLPTLTPAKPLPQSGAYDLADWPPEQADYLVRLMEGYPETLPSSARSKDETAYYQAFSYAAFAQREALLQFPNWSQADQWRWGLAYNLARIGDLQAGRHYADLIVNALNRGDVDIDYLYTWFQGKEPRQALYMVELIPLPGYIASYLIEIRGNGSTFVWLIQTSSAYQSHPLLTHFDFVRKPQANWIVADFDGNSGDGEQLAVYYSTQPDQFYLDAPKVISMARIPPREMGFLPDEAIFNVGMDFVNYWAVNSNPTSGNNIIFKSTVFPACPVTIRREYHWNGKYFAFWRDQYEFDTTPLSLSYCQTVVDHSAHTWGPGGTIQLMEALLAYWPPAENVAGEPYPDDAGDEWRYRLGIYHALLGETNTALGYFNEVISNPAVINSRWIVPAQDFRAVYKTPEDIYRACVQASFCDPAYAIETLVDTMPPDVDALQYLRQSGVDTNSSGFFDFDDDEEAERWFTVRHQPRQKSEFWILAKYARGSKAMWVTNVELIPPTLDTLDKAYVDQASLHLRPAVFLDGSLAFSMQRLPDTQEPFLQNVPLRAEYPNRFFDALEIAEKALFSGVLPRIVQGQLLVLEDYPGLLCQHTWSCDLYYYLLGLSSELAGDERQAIKAYHRLWSDYSKSPYTIMARLKLAGQAYVSPTPTPTVTPTTTVTPTPTITGTPPTSTPTLSPTPSVTGTIFTATPTTTSTSSIIPTVVTTLTSTPTITRTPTATEPYPYPPSYPTNTPYP